VCCGAVLLLKEEVALRARPPSVLADQIAESCRDRAPSGLRGGSSVRVVNAVAVKVYDVHHRPALVLKPRQEVDEGGRAQKLYRHPSRRLRLERVQHCLGIGTGIYECGVSRAAHHDEEVQLVFGCDVKGPPPPARARQAPTHRDAWLLEKEVGACRVIQELPGLAEHRRVIAIDGQEPSHLGLILEAVDQARGCGAQEDGSGERSPPAWHLVSDTRGLGVVHLGGIVGGSVV
jgi:hypothetical protein